MQQQLRPPFGVQTGCKRTAVKLRVRLQFLFPPTTDTTSQNQQEF
jgi:hypothetical protein